MTQVSHRTVISGVGRCADSVMSSTSMLILHALDVFSIHVGDSDGDYNIFSLWAPHKML